MPDSQRQFLTNMLAAASLYPQLIGPVQKMYSDVYGHMHQFGEHSGKAMLLAAAFDGMTLLELLNFHQFTAEQRALLRTAFAKPSANYPINTRFFLPPHSSGVSYASSFALSGCRQRAAECLPRSACFTSQSRTGQN
jgi:hypothetical protein